MLTDWVEANVQKAITEQPAAYRNCNVVQVEWIEAEAGAEETDDQPPPKPEVRVSFVKVEGESAADDKSSAATSGSADVHRNL